MTRTILSLTSIPPRLPLIGPMLRSLTEQSAAIERVILWIPERYRRFDAETADLGNIPEGVEVRRCPQDLGPATKVLPAVAAYRGEDVRILYCDDDRIYHRDWAAHLLAESDRHPEACIAEAGEVLEATVRRAFGAGWRYQVLTKATLGIYGHAHRKRLRALDPGNGPVDIAKGYGGVVIRPDFLPDFAFDIPDDLWMVDDFWISGCLAVAGVPIRKTVRIPHSSKTEVAGIDALIDLVAEGRDRHAANLACVRYFRETHGVWRHAPIR